jgi:NADPH:quinone reductase-like Zn-dependent oxidoreductase
MVAVTFSRFGKPAEVVQVEERPDPVPGPDEALVELLAAPINPADLSQLEGLYGTLPPLPAVAGMEGVGRVVALGAEAKGVAVGQRVFLPLGSGTWRSHLTARADRLLPAPDGDPLQLSMLSINPPTAQLLLESVVPLQPGEWVLQNAANSAVGRLLIVLARRAGLHTINVVRRPELAEELRALGADVVLEESPELAKQVLLASGGNAPRLGIDCIGGASTGRLGDALADGGTVVNYGLLSNRPPIMSPGSVIFRGISLRGFWLTRWLSAAPREQRTALYSRLASLVAEGTLRVPVDATFPLARVADAVARAQKGGRSGKVLLVP